MICLNITQKPNQAEIEGRKKRKARARVYRYGLNMWLLFTGFCMGFTPYCFQYAELERGYSAIGGEIFIPVLPLLMYPLFNGVCNFIVEWKGWD